MLHHITQVLLDYGIFGILILAFADSAGIPIPEGMDALLVLVAATRPSQAWYGAAVAVAGSVVGNIILFLAARKGGQAFWEHTPGHSSRFRQWFDRYGLATVFIPALVPLPLPLKIFVITAGVLRTRLSSFILVVLVARTIRYFGEAYLGLTLGPQAMQFIAAHFWQLVGLAAVLAVLIFLIIRHRTRGKDAAEA